jgi:hypothetical protein
MSNRSAKTKVASSLLPSVMSPQPRCSAPALIHRNPLESVLHVRAEFGDFAKDYYVVEFGPRAGIVAVSEGVVQSLQHGSTCPRPT